MSKNNQVEGEHIKVNMTGEEYMRYLEKKAEYRHNLLRQLKVPLTVLATGLVLIVLILALHSMMGPQPDGIDWTWKGVAMFIVICAGLGWIFHGTGFLLIRR